MRTWPLHWQILAALVLGVATGLILQTLGDGTRESIVFFLSLGADIFLRLLKMIILPLVATSLFIGVTNVSSTQSLGRLGGRTAIYYVTTSFLSILTGLLFVNLLRPGVGADLPLAGGPQKEIVKPGSMWDIATRIIPSNPFESFAEFDMLGVIFFVILIGVFTMKSPQKDRDAILSVVKPAFNIIMRAVGAIIQLAPIGVFCLVGKMVSSLGLNVFMPLLFYVTTVSLALAFHFFVTLPFILWFVARRSPIQYLRALSPALLTAFSSASSSATLPLTLECAERNGGVSNRVSSMVLPLGATINMDGTALYEGVAVVFIAQVLGYDLSLAQQMTVFLTALMVSVGAAGIPHAGLVMMVIILEAVGLPLEATGMIWAVDRVVDMARTATNVWSDSVGAAVIDKMEGPQTG